MEPISFVQYSHRYKMPSFRMSMWEFFNNNSYIKNAFFGNWSLELRGAAGEADNTIIINELRIVGPWNR